jgi:hypothetical protein
MSSCNNKRNDRTTNPNTSPKELSPKNYFLTLADNYSKASHILFISLAVCLIFTLLFNSKLLTYNNFNYLLKDIDSAVEIASENYNSISYTNDELRVTKSFRGGIVTASTTDIAIYTATGKKTLYANEIFVVPEIVSSQKYAIVYDLGGYNYNVYNSFANVHSQKCDYPISSISVSDSGLYAVSSRDNEHSSVVYLYDNDFNLINTYLFASKYVFSVSINSSGDRIAIITAEPAPEGDKFLTSVMICEPGKKSDIATIELTQCIPYGSAFTESGDLQIICSNGLYILDSSNGAVKNKFEIKNDRALRVSIGKYGCAIALANNSGTVNNEILVFNQHGTMIYNVEVMNGILDLEYYKDYIFIYQQDSLLKINVKNNKDTITPIFDQGSEIIVYNENNILICCQTKAKYLKI